MESYLSLCQVEKINLHRDICHPINSPAREKIQSAIFEAYKNAPETEVNEENNDSEVNE